MFLVYKKNGSWEGCDRGEGDGGLFLGGRLLAQRGSGPGKFCRDWCFGPVGRLFVAFEGVLLNSSRLLQRYGAGSVGELVGALYGRDREFFREFRGNFSGFVYDRDSGGLLVFSDHLSNRPVFYYEDGECFVAGTSVWEIAGFCRERERLRLDRGGCYSLLTYAYMYHDRTIFDGVRRLLPGWYALVREGRLERRQFYQIAGGPERRVPMGEAVDRLDSLFSHAVGMQVEKNREYGLANYAPLSAGLDSRITTMALGRLQAGDVISFTYSETGQLDQEVPMRIARELGNRWLFKSLDNGQDLLQIDRAIETGGSLVYYAWPAQLEDFLELASSQRMGVVHTGVIGDVVVGTFVRRQGEEDRAYKIGDGAYSKRLLGKLRENIAEADYRNYEVGMMHNRAINGAAMGYSTTFQKYGEGCSPFMDVDFMDYCLSLPVSYRFQHKIYYKWVERHYPKAMAYGHNGLRISTSSLGIPIKGKLIRLGTIPSRVRLLVESHMREGYGMNPMDHWYWSNQSLARHMDGYFLKCTTLGDLDRELWEDTRRLYKEGNALEKIMAISLAGSVERIFGGDGEKREKERLGARLV